MSLVKKAAVAAALTVGAPGAVVAGAAGYVLATGEFPEIVPISALPPELPRNNEGLICEMPPKPCNTESNLGRLATQQQTDIPITRVSPHAINALIDAEDSNYPEHNGVDSKHVLRALGHNTVTLFKRVLGGSGTIHGGSGITRQYAGKALKQPTNAELEALGPGYKYGVEYLPGLTREAFEASVAIELEKRFDKAEILEKYFNAIPFARGIGIEAASQAMFNKPAADLDDLESAMLIGTVAAPGAMDMNVFPEDLDKPEFKAQYDREHNRLLNRTRYVIGRMEKNGHMPKARADELRKIDDLRPRIAPFKAFSKIDFSEAAEIGAQQFTRQALKEAVEKAAKAANISEEQLKTGGYKIYTTLNRADQTALYNAISQEQKLQDPSIEAAGIIMAKNGAITAMMGDKADRQQANFAMGSKGGGNLIGRQPGSSLKPYLWAYALENGWDLEMKIRIPAPSDPDNKARIEYDNGRKVYEIAPHGECRSIGRPEGCEINLVEALALSSNYVAGLIMQEFGIEPVAERMVRGGIKLEKPYLPSIGLGGKEVSLHDLVLAMNNLYVRRGSALPESFMVVKIEDKSGNIVYEYEPPQTLRVFPEEVALKAIAAANSVITNPAGTAYNAFNLPSGPDSAAGKTGTTNQTADIWFTASMCHNDSGGQTAGVWIGRRDGNKALSSEFRSFYAAQITGKALTAIAQPTPCSLK